MFKIYYKYKRYKRNFWHLFHKINMIFNISKE